MSSPLSPLHRIQKMLKNEAALLGLELQHVVWMPGDPGDPTVLQAYFAITPDAVKTDEDKLDEEFMAIMGGLEEVQPTSDPVLDAKEKLAEDFKKGKGIFCD